MVVNVLLFAILRERAGTDSVDVEVREGATVADAIDALRARPELEDVLARMPIRMAVNREYADGGAVLAAGDELALVPPVSGGAGDPEPEVHARVTSESLDACAVAALVSRPAAGAVVTFQGTTRDVARLDYEAYTEMAAERIEQILRDCVRKHGLEAAAAEHRTGPVQLLEPSVIVAVSAAHREEAFAGAREAIDRIKAEAPIWKKEVEGESGAERSRWVEGTLPGSSSDTSPSETRR